MKVRVGLGYDVHPLEKAYDLWLGGVKIESEKGAIGHSDADVLIHAICDALLGAANLRDIGYHFSNKDPKWKNANSKIFLIEVVKMLSEKGWRIENVDCTICLEEPKVNPHVAVMKKIMAPLLHISEDDISIKATTSEKLGYVGRGEGINAMAVALIVKD